MKVYVVAPVMMALLVPNLAEAGSIYQGCAVPAVKAGRHTFYVDPNKGSAKGDGSLAKPWRTLAEVITSNLVASKGHNYRTWSSGDTSLIDVNPKAPIKAGDVIMLMSGDHGSVSLSNMFNMDFINVMAAPGQTPTVSRLLVGSSAKWNFQGLQIVGKKPQGYGRVDGLVTIGYSDWLGATNNIILQNSTLAAANDVSSWSDQEWVSAPYAYAVFLSSGTSCSSITGNHILNGYGGLAIGGADSIIQGNTIEKMTNDGIDIYASDILVKGNTIKNGMNNRSSVAHADAIQGWSPKSGGTVVTNQNVTIDSNMIIKTGATSTSYLQGIGIFDGTWENLNITNNMVVSNAFHGITVSGVKSGAIINNTVVASDASTGTWIMVKGGSGTVTVRNNITPALVINGSGIVDDHNIIATKGNYSPTDRYDSTIMSKFVTLNNSTATYDLRPKAGSPALGFGVAAKAPLVDIVGRARLPTVTAGAYN